MLRIQHPPAYLPERSYILDVVLRDFLGLDYVAASEERQDVLITVAGDAAHRRLFIDDSFFATPESSWLTEASLPERPLSVIELAPPLVPERRVSDRLPVLFGAGNGSSTQISCDVDQIRLPLDVFGSSFFMLSRYEELARPAVDTHERFPAAASLAGQAGFLDRPIVNEYVELLWTCLAQLWPGLSRKPRTARVLMSHDVDWPIVTLGRTALQALRGAAGDIVLRRDPVLSLRRLNSWRHVQAGAWDRDVGNTFDLMMDTNEQHGLPTAFYFIAGHTAGEIDGTYSLDDPWIQQLMRRIADRGHEIGLHPSYNTYLDPAATRTELEQLLAICHKLGIDQPAWGGRQHFLRWRNPTTWQNWEQAGLAYDSTLGYADAPGFRCGVCYAFQAYDLRARRPLNLIERPLIVMDATLLGHDKPASLPLTQAIELIVGLKDRCALFDGDFTLLWHNTWLLEQRQRAAYRTCLAALTR